MCSSKHAEGEGNLRAVLTITEEETRHPCFLLCYYRTGGGKKAPLNQRSPTKEKRFAHGHNSSFLPSAIFLSFHLFSSILSPESLVQQHEQNWIL